MDNMKYGNDLLEAKLNKKELDMVREAAEKAKYEQYEAKLNKMRQLMEKGIFQDKIMNTMTGTAEVSSRRKSSKDELTRRLSQSIERYSKEISKATEALEKVKEMKFDVGNVAFHTKLGNVVITDIYLESEQESVYMEIRADFTDGYVYQVVGAEGKGFVREHELTEITEITKNLYGK